MKWLQRILVFTLLTFLSAQVKEINNVLGAICGILCWYGYMLLLKRRVIFNWSLVGVWCLIGMLSLFYTPMIEPLVEMLGESEARMNAHGATEGWWHFSLLGIVLIVVLPEIAAFVLYIWVLFPEETNEFFQSARLKLKELPAKFREKLLPGIKTVAALVAVGLVSEGAARLTGFEFLRFVFFFAIWFGAKRLITGSFELTPSRLAFLLVFMLIGTFVLPYIQEETRELGKLQIELLEGAEELEEEITLRRVKLASIHLVLTALMIVAALKKKRVGTETDAPEEK